MISVWMPVYNEEAHLQRALDSVLSQTWTDFVLLASNNHSTDRSGKILQAAAARDPRIRLFAPPRHCTGLEHTQYMTTEVLPAQTGRTYSIFIGGHDVWDANLLQVLFERAEAEPQCAIVYTDSFEVDAAGQVVRRYEGKFQTKEVARPFIPLQVLMSLTHNLVWGGLWREAIRRRVPNRHHCSAADHLLLAEVALHGSILYQAGSAVRLGAARDAGDWTTYARKHIPEATRRHPILDFLNQLEWCSHLVDVATDGSGFGQDPFKGALKSALYSAYVLRYVDTLRGHPGGIEAFFSHPLVQQYLGSTNVSSGILDGLIQGRNSAYPT
jgi:Glycosyl transferase family 2